MMTNRSPKSSSISVLSYSDSDDDDVHHPSSIILLSSRIFGENFAVHRIENSMEQAVLKKVHLGELE